VRAQGDQLQEPKVENSRAALVPENKRRKSALPPSPSKSSQKEESAARRSPRDLTSTKKKIAEGPPEPVEQVSSQEWTDDDTRRAIQLKKQGLSYGEIGREMGFHHKTVWSHIKDTDADDAEPQAPRRKRQDDSADDSSESEKRSKFTWDAEVQERAEALAAEGKSQRIIGEILGCHQTTVGKHLREGS
jgi:DNA-binding CsgD family transcriptional regulator